MLAEAAAEGATRATLEVRRSNEPARRLYERFGFAFAGVRTAYYREPVEDALVLWRNRPRPRWSDRKSGYRTGRLNRREPGGDSRHKQIARRNPVSFPWTNGPARGLGQRRSGMAESLDSGLRRQLLQTDEEFRALSERHHELDTRLHQLAERSHLDDNEQVEESTLKKRKLQLKDRMEDILRRQVAAPRTASASVLDQPVSRVAALASSTRHEPPPRAGECSGPVARPRDHHTMMGIDRAGAPFVGGALVLAALAAWLGSGWWWAIPFVLLAAFLGFFFRDPDRVIGSDALAVLSPADGRVMVAGPGEPSVAPEGDWQQISIFLSPMDVHINRVPYGGTLTRVTYQPGRFLPAYRSESGAQNERTELWVERDGRTVVFRQVVGVLARRVVCRVREGETVKTGDRFGLMKFGSRMDVFVDRDARLLVKAGETVRAGETRLAEFAVRGKDGTPC